jgi:hypothetical protein
MAKSSIRILSKYILIPAVLAISACASNESPQPEPSVPQRVEHLGQIPEPTPKVIYKTKTKVVQVKVPASTPAPEPKPQPTPEPTKKHWWQKKHHWWK